MNLLRDKYHPLLRQSLILCMGFASGLPLALTGTTLQAWLANGGVNIKTIGLFAAIGIPYTWKFLWSPLMDRYYIPRLGRRRTWLFLTQISLLVTLNWLSTISPQEHLREFTAIALFIAFFSASQDIVIDAYRTDLLNTHERGLGSAMAVLGYRLSMLVSGAGALVLASFYGFHRTYQFMAILMVLMILISALAPEPIDNKNIKTNYSFTEPIKEFLTRNHAISIILLIMIYKLSDALAGSLTTAFLLKGVHFSLIEVGAVNKGVGLGATLLGAIAGGLLMSRWSLYRSLFVFGLLQGSAALSFSFLATEGHHTTLMITSVFLENFTSGMGTTALSALLMSLCHHQFSATQFALLSALSAFGRVYLAPLAGYLVETVGWVDFFIISTLASLPSLLIIRLLKETFEQLNSEDPSNPIHG